MTADLLRGEAMPLKEAMTLALALAARGVHVFPVGLSWDPTKYDGQGGIDKRPLNEHGRKDATTDAREIRRQFNKAHPHAGEVLGVGACYGLSDRLVVDVDDKGDVCGSDALAELEARHGPLPESVRLTTPSGGAHIILGARGRHIGNDGLAEGIDIRAHDGWGVAGGTYTPWGEWAWEGGIGILEGGRVDDGPDWLLDTLAPLNGPATNGSTAGPWTAVDDAKLHPADRAALAALKRLGGHSEFIPRGKSHIELTRPDKRAGTSATIGYVGPGIVKVFSPNWQRLEARVYDADQLDAIADGETPDDDRGGRTDGETQDIVDDAEEEAASWIFRDLGPALRDEVVEIAPTILDREDGRSHFYVNQVNGLHGDSGTGKSLIALKGATQEMAKGNHVIWVDAEDPNERTIVARLRALAIPEADILERFHYVSPQTPAGPGAIRRIRTAIELYRPTMVVLDSVGELFGLEGLNEDKDTDVGPWMRRVARAIADAGTAVVLIDHSTKAADNPLHASGSKRKRAAITGAAYLVEVTRPLAKGQDGRLKLTCAKDRHGTYARGEHVSSIEVNSYPDDGISIHVYPPSPKEKDPDLGVILLARAAVKAAKGQTTPVTTNALVGLMNARGAATLKRAGCELAAARGFLRATAGPNRSVLYEYVSDWVDAPNA